MLGGFSVHRFGRPVSLPLSLAAQGLKIVTINQRIPVDELVELLWPEAGPGVGTRRLRNVLWRVRAASGELLVRDDNFIRLADDAVTDIAQFRRLAEQALDRETEPETAARMARDALVLYRGELLPGDRYADWAAGVREALARGHIQLLDLLLNDALTHQHIQEALALLELHQNAFVAIAAVATHDRRTPVTQFVEQPAKSGLRMHRRVLFAWRDLYIEHQPQVADPVRMQHVARAPRLVRVVAQLRTFLPSVQRLDARVDVDAQLLLEGRERARLDGNILVPGSF